MAGCGYCYVCDMKQCPKEGKERLGGYKHIGISKNTVDRLKRLCEDTGKMRGDKYYRVHDYNEAIQFLLEKYNSNINQLKNVVKKEGL
jgi:hypothetical protein